MSITREELSERYGIPYELLDEYARLNLCGQPGARQFDEADVERLSVIMTLHESGFSADEIAEYMRLLSGGESSKAERMAILERRRAAALDEIHASEARLARIDYLRHELKKRG